MSCHWEQYDPGQKPGMFISGKQALKFFGWVVFWTGVLAVIVWMAASQ